MTFMVAMTTIATIYAQEEPKFTVKPTGRILFDAAYINPQHQEDKLNSGAGIPDMPVSTPASTSSNRCDSPASSSAARKDLPHLGKRRNTKKLWPNVPKLNKKSSLHIG